MADAGSEVSDAGGAYFRIDDGNCSFSPSVSAENAESLGFVGGGIDVVVDDEVEANRRRQTRRVNDDGPLERKSRRNGHGKSINVDDVGCCGDRGR